MNGQDQTYMNGQMPYQNFENIGLPNPLHMHTEIVRQQERMRIAEKKLSILCKKMEGMEEMKASYAGMKRAFWIVMSSGVGLMTVTLLSKISINW